MAESAYIVYTTNTIGGKVSDGFDEPMEPLEDFEYGAYAFDDHTPYDEAELASEDDYYGSENE